MPHLAKVHELPGQEENYGQGRGGRPWRRKRARILAPTTVTTYITRVRSKYLAAGRPARSKSRLLAHALRDGWIRLEDFA